MFGEKRGGAPSCSPLTLPLASPATLTLQQQRTFPSAGQRKYLRESRPAVGGPTDSSLTSLGWLQNLKVPDLFSPEVRVMLHPPSPCSEDGCSSWETVSSSSTYSPPAGNNDPLLCAGGNAPRSPSPLRQCLLHSTEFRSAPKRYRSDSTKPHFPHTSLVYLALQHSRSGKASFYEICRWIKTNFKFFKESEPGWQDSIKESLLRNELFVKVARANGESSKGTCWSFHPRLIEYLEKETSSQLHMEGDGGKKLKRAFSYSGKDSRQSRGGRGEGRKRIKSEVQAPVDPCGLPGDLDWISLLSSQRVSCGSYGSPILGPPDLGQVGDPMICSPLVVPTSITTTSHTSTVPDPALDSDLKDDKEDEDVFRNHNSCHVPPPHLLPWEDPRPVSPSRHPWAESRETTLNSLGRQRQTVALPSLNHTLNPICPPESSCYSFPLSCSTSTNLSRGYSKSQTAESYIY